MQDWEQHDQDQNNHKRYHDAHPLPALPLLILGDLQLVRSPLYKRCRLVHVLLNIVQLLSLRFDQRCHVHEYLVQFDQVPLDLLHSIVPFLDLFYRVQDLTSPLLLDRLLKERLAVSSLYDVLNCLVTRVFSCHGVESATQT
jgi:hypothetical protein